MKKYIVAVLGAGFFWGFMGFFTRNLAQYGVGSSGAIVVRCGVAALLFGLLILLRDPKQFRVKLKDAWCFLGSGLLSLLFFTFCYFNAMSMMSLSVAAILLYTAPTIVMLLSVILFKEKITKLKVLAVILALVGCALVSGITEGATLTLKGLLFGLGSGFAYALYTIFSRYALQRGYSSSTINFYSCLLASLGAMAIWGVKEVVTAVSVTPSVLIWYLATGGISCFLPYLLYTYSLTGLENSKASVISSVEPVVATFLGVIVYHEKLTFVSILGMLAVLAAILLLNVTPKSTGAKK